MTKIVVDTNVLVHGCNPNNAYFGRVTSLIEQFSATDWEICVDEGLSAIEAENRSRIWSEYRNHIPQGSLAFEFITQLLIEDRVKDFPVRVAQDIHNMIRSKVVDPSDVVFVKVSYNSDSLYLVSHDFAAFPMDVRDFFRENGISNVVDCYGVANN